MKENDSRRKIGIFGSVPVFALPKINSVNELKAMVGISSFQGTNENAFPSIPILAERIGLSPAATSTAVSGLVRKDLVCRKRNYGRANTYYLLYETESKEEIKAHNKEEKRKERAKRLQENIQSFESLEYSKVSNDEYSKSSNISPSKVSNDILKEHIKRTEENTTETDSKTLIESLKEIAHKNGLVYSKDIREEGKYKNLLMDMNQTDTQILEQAQRYEAILQKEPTLFWLKNDAFGCKFLKYNWGRIDSWYANQKTKVISLKRKTYSAEEHKRIKEEYERSRNAS